MINLQRILSNNPLHEPRELLIQERKYDFHGAGDATSQVTIRLHQTMPLQISSSTISGLCGSNSIGEIGLLQRCGVEEVNDEILLHLHQGEEIVQHAREYLVGEASVLARGFRTFGLAAICQG